ncbi:MAG: hypothetical protein J3K34DRAFT_419025 [Monoraphidium minutum]|nr:MAG: hypothetical protein J3K34DRAFT_419025 [Monoraphidium minutum]
MAQTGALWGAPLPVAPSPFFTSHCPRAPPREARTSRPLVSCLAGCAPCRTVDRAKRLRSHSRGRQGAQTSRLLGKRQAAKDQPSVFGCVWGPRGTSGAVLSGEGICRGRRARRLPGGCVLQSPGAGVAAGQEKGRNQADKRILKHSQKACFERNKVLG